MHVKDQQAVHALQELSQLYQQGRQDPVVAGLLEEILELMIDRPEVQPVHDEPSYDELVKINGYLTEQLDTIYQLLHGIDAHIKEVFTPTMWDRIIKIHKVNE
ncbi:hypothetical protein JCM19038_2824 [Geomicrobium sp. JCM 19038]|nr:hypothetical protein JCM19038_2824 [Geomicrobium sp. JCM 19038]